MTIPPYRSEEIAQAVQEALRRAGSPDADVVVAADLQGRRWLISARWPGGRHTASYPFSEPDGIHTPAELAAWFAREASAPG